MISHKSTSFSNHGFPFEIEFMAVYQLLIFHLYGLCFSSVTGLNSELHEEYYFIIEIRGANTLRASFLIPFFMYCYMYELFWVSMYVANAFVVVICCKTQNPNTPLF